jgi:hypothetical protein
MQRDVKIPGRKLARVDVDRIRIWLGWGWLAGWLGWLAGGSLITLPRQLCTVLLSAAVRFSFCAGGPITSFLGAASVGSGPSTVNGV